MWAWLKLAMAVLVVVMPGGFPLVLAYIATRTLLERWRQAQAQAREEGRPVSVVRDVVGALHFRDLIREARAATAL
ncbi:hypothetical protein KH5H1_00840 [Corallococcus caeni]|uniref:Uncharacterized protein n=3 Tax=Corallococcus TaxID=83461 RepID=A0A3A8IGI4_9BACT|nr:MULTISPECIES: hypothetical protein [Corallococcus]GMT95965.1 hypothetical protein KH5H1_00840 [Corallococcus sp. KH5-1]GMU07792.1 hypothetical protein ASNO1_40450 [Corallococcus sp. NO1]NOK09220.1 hypothetical protein [Corallococcus exercitus]NOK36168.1 hypothetical protein [Corallococcus exercitus]RKG76613.1 hypothetical protein D7W79_17435 [Corallococcus exercitus]